jgi:hypothetical protein
MYINGIISLVEVDKQCENIIDYKRYYFSKDFVR